MKLLSKPIPTDADPGAARRSLLIAGVAVLFVLVFGTLGYYALGGGEWALIDCFYMTVITLTTVGYGEVLPVSRDLSTMIFTLILLFSGMGVILYFASIVTGFVINGDLHYLVRRQRMNKKIDEMSGHHIVCGLRGPGEHVVHELGRVDAPFVVIDNNPDAIDEVQQHLGHEIPYILGDATRDEILERAGIARCKTIIITLENDRDNIFCTLAARTLNPTMRIVTQGDDPTAEQKFKLAGADKVIYTNTVGGQRMANEVLRPNVTTFLDLMLRDTSRRLGVEEIEVSESSHICGRPLRLAGLRQKTDILVIAIYKPSEGQHFYNPPPDFVIEAGHVLILLGEHKDVEYLREHVV